MKKAIVIGASSGMGRQLAKLLANDGYELGLVARRVELLKELERELATKCYVKFMDVSKPQDAVAGLQELIAEMGDVDLIIISSGTGYVNSKLELKLEQDTIDTNVSGVTAVINVAMHHFMEQEKGHLVAISSIAGLRGMSGDAPAYGATKAYLSNYLQSLRAKVEKQKFDISITDIKPGFVDTAMAQGEGLFWVMPVETTCKQIFNAIKKKKKDVVVTRRWKILAFFIKRMK